ncbi:GNAT family N-acetyltransferase [Thalassospira sp. TSL5-1]|uniref:GNAT family N-acetyltransferase n=1 Tax=Thalassospira sp. TSL5-1 TaxID=1544451 RepID=UPI00093B65C0|nr:GNAT family N-acetyltransferase [Thalassospira sp. TSL5-1]
MSDRQPSLTTDRLVLEPFGEDHVPALARANMDERVMRYIREPSPDYASAEASIRKILLQDDGELGIWGVRLRENNEVIGLGILRPMPDKSDVEVGYRLTVPHWGKGYATEIARCLINYGFGTVKLATITATFDTENSASRHVLEKCGLRDDGMTKAYHAHGTPLVRINRADWKNQLPGPGTSGD